MNNFINQHPTLLVIIGTFLVNYVWSAFVGALPAPTVSSGQFYKFIFKFFNLLAANISRAKNTAIENSPNFILAAQKAVDTGVIKNGGQLGNASTLKLP